MASAPPAPLRGLLFADGTIPLAQRCAVLHRTSRPRTLLRCNLSVLSERPLSRPASFMPVPLLAGELGCRCTARIGPRMRSKRFKSEGMYRRAIQTFSLSQNSADSMRGLTLSVAAAAVVDLACALPALNSRASAPSSSYASSSSSYTSSASPSASASSSASPPLASTNFSSSLPLPYTPSGGFGTNGSQPVYAPLTDFDSQSLNLALYQELIELDLFHYGVAKFSREEFQEVGMNDDDVYLLQYMADQEAGHATAIANMLGPNNASKSCEYSYPVQSVKEYLQFSESVTRFGEAGAYGFLEHLNSRDAAQIMLQAITVEARQEMILRQFEGIFPMPFWFNPAITQSMQWTLLAPYIVGCPDNNTRVQFQNFPALNITNNPNVSALTVNATPAASSNETSFTTPGQTIYLEWENPGKQVGPNNSYTTNTTAGEPKFVAWISQLNTTYTPLTNISGNSGHTIQPNVTIYQHSEYTNGSFAPLINGTVFVLVVDEDIPVTPANLTFLNEHVVAGPAAYFSG